MLQPHQLSSVEPQIAGASGVTNSNIVTKPKATAIGEFVVVGFLDDRHRSLKRYVCVVKAVDDDDVEIECLRRQKPSSRLFAAPIQPDVCWQSCDNYVQLPSVPKLDARGRHEFQADIDGTE